MNIDIMKKIKSFYLFKENKSIIDRIDDKDLFIDTYTANPLHKTHDFFVFIYKDGFRELDDGNYKKIMDIENMHKITPDNFKDMTGMYFRASMTEQKVGVIWWPKEGSELIDGKSSNNMDLYLIDLIEKHMSKDHKTGRDVYKKIYDKNMKKSKKIKNLDNQIDEYDKKEKEWKNNRDIKKKKFNL
jgi:hypothetical protein